MDLFLVRYEFRADGIISKLLDQDGNHILTTLEHAYLKDAVFYDPKLPDGTYNCLRGLHKLHPDSEPFETFEVMGVPEHDGILFHSGNISADSDGCILLGLSLGNINGQKAVLNSKVAFTKFMAFLQGYDEFFLTVRSP